MCETSSFVPDWQLCVSMPTLWVKMEARGHGAGLHGPPTEGVVAKPEIRSPVLAAREDARPTGNSNFTTTRPAPRLTGTVENQRLPPSNL